MKASVGSFAVHLASQVGFFPLSHYIRVSSRQNKTNKQVNCEGGEVLFFFQIKVGEIHEQDKEVEDVG